MRKQITWSGEAVEWTTQMLQGLCQLLQLILINQARKREMGKTEKSWQEERKTLPLLDSVVHPRSLDCRLLAACFSAAVAVVSSECCQVKRFNRVKLRPKQRRHTQQEKLISILLPWVAPMNGWLRRIAVFNFATWICQKRTNKNEEEKEISCQHYCALACLRTCVPVSLTLFARWKFAWFRFYG